MDILPLPPLSELRQILHYDSENGLLIHLKRNPEMFSDGGLGKHTNCKRWNTKFAGKKAGYIDKSNNSLTIKINSEKYYGHRICYSLYHNIELPVEIEIDHKNRDRSDNRITNLRIANRGQQNQNTKIRSDNTSGYKGISWDKVRCKWKVRINVDGKEIMLGRFVDLNEAIKCRQEAEKKYFGEYAAK